MIRLTREQIYAARTKRGGWSRETLAGWGVNWPPAKGWIVRLTKGEDPNA